MYMREREERREDGDDLDLFFWSSNPFFVVFRVHTSLQSLFRIQNTKDDFDFSRIRM